MDTRPLPNVEFRLPEADGGVAMARRFTRDTLASWHYRGSYEEAVLVVSELVTNAILHGRGSRTLRLIGTAWRVRIEVADDNPVPPAIRQGGADGGWGMRLIEQLTTDWGVSPRDGGKVVWGEVHARIRPALVERRETVA